MKATGDQQLLKRINRSVLLRLIRAEAGLSRADLSRRSGLTKSTVSALVRELIDEKWLVQARAPVAAEGMGRPSTPLQLDAQTRVLMGVEISVEYLRVVCVTLTGNVMSQVQVPLASSVPERVCKQASELVLSQFHQLAARHLLLSGIGVCLPGAIHEETGQVSFAPNLGWRHVPFASMIAAAFFEKGVPTVPLHLQNDADAAALSEYEFTSNDDEGSLIFISCDVGVGAGIILNDRLFVGATGMAGEVGHTTLQIDGPLCSCGRLGCAEVFLGSRALRVAKSAALAGKYLGVLIHNLDVMFNPKTIVLGGLSCITRPEMIEKAIVTLSKYSTSADLPLTPIRVARYGLLAAAVGSAALVWHRFLRPMSVADAVVVQHLPNATLIPNANLSRKQRSEQHVGVQYRAATKPARLRRSPAHALEN
jgi:predicted NBD/HSP70 family sugar kinase/DNA-binding XRE family transcriptional regulator